MHIQLHYLKSKGLTQASEIRTATEEESFHKGSSSIRPSIIGQMEVICSVNLGASRL